MTYLDHAASTPVRPEVIEVLAHAFGVFGNAGSVHSVGRAARARLEDARESLAASLQAHPSEVVFTSGGTEGDNLGVIGLYRRRRAADPRRRRIVASAIEHPAVIEAVGHLVDHEDAQVTWVTPARDGLLTGSAVDTALGSGDDVALVSCMWVNNEIGTVAEMAQIHAVARDRSVPVHTDAVQAVGHVPVSLREVPVSVLTLTGHKLGGPMGAGAVVVRREAPVQATSFGGGQERALRSGTVSVALAVALAEAVERAVADVHVESARQAALRDALLDGILAVAPDAIVTGAWTRGDVTRRSPSNAHVLLPGCDADALLTLLDLAGVQASTGSACHAGVSQPSHVVLALGHGLDEARGALRLTLGWDSTEADVAHFLDVFPGALDRARAARRTESVVS